MQNLIEKLGLGESTGALMLWIGLAVLLLVVVLALATWLIRTLRPTLNLSGSSARGGRPQRLAITDAFTLDRDGRKLVIIRRDNVEHLILIGGPNDVVVEQNIVRGERAFRERTSARALEPDAIQAAEAALTGEAPSPAAQAAPTPAVVRPVVAPVPPPPVAAARGTAPSVTQVPSTPRLDDEFERALSAMQQQVAQRQEAPPRQDVPSRQDLPQRQATAPAQPPAPQRPAPSQPAPPLQTPPSSAPQAPAPQSPAPAGARMPMPAAPPVPPPSAPRAEPPRTEVPRTEPMSEMARRLNEVLAKPMSGTLRPPFNKPIPPVPPVSSMPQRPMPAPAAPPVPPLPPEPPAPPP
ncbi:MAG: hypothetical protein ACK4YX_05895, partial [Rhabdaerophilum calidifontis]